VKEGDPERELG